MLLFKLTQDHQAFEIGAQVRMEVEDALSLRNPVVPSTHQHDLAPLLSHDTVFIRGPKVKPTSSVFIKRHLAEYPIPQIGRAHV